MITTLRNRKSFYEKAANSMKNRYVWVFLSAILFLSGCAQIKQLTGPKDLQETPPKKIVTDDSHLSASYFYLESRIHDQKNETLEAIASLEKAIGKDPDSAFLKRDLIRFYLKQKETDKALALAESLVAQDPKNVDNLLILVQLKQQTDPDDQLSDLLKKILALDPQNRETYLRLGKIYMENQNQPEALALFTQMVEYFPDYYVAFFYLGEAQLLMNNPEAAKEAFLKTIELEPELVEPRFRLIEIYKSQEKEFSPEKILESFEKILEIEPGNDRALLEMALFYYQNNQKNKAGELFAELGRGVDENSRVIMVAVDTFISEKRYEDAVIVFSQMLAADPDNANLNFFTGMAYEAIEDLPTAITHYLKVTPDHPQFKKTLLTIAFIYRDLGKIDQAILFLEQHHAKTPKDIDIISYLASFYEEQTRYDNAMDLLEKGLQDAPDNTILLFRLGAIQDKAGLKDQCIQTMQTILQLDPENVSALNYLGYTYADMGVHLDQALDLIQRAMELKPHDGYITDSLGWVYYQLQDYEKAVQYLEQAAELSEFESIITSHLADAYAKNGQPAKALVTYKKALANAKKEDTVLIQELGEKIAHLEKELNE